MSDTSQTSAYLFVADQLIRKEDARQDAYLAILEQRPQTYAEAEAIVNCVIHSTRNATRKRPMQLSAEPCTDALKSSGIHAAIAKLPAEEADLIHLRYISGLTIREIADRNNKSVGYTHETLTAALAKLKVILGE